MSFREGWDEAIEANIKVNPGTFESKSIHCPLAPSPSKTVVAEATRHLEEGRRDDSEEFSDSDGEDIEATSGKKTFSPQADSSSEGGSDESSEAFGSSSEGESSKKKQKTKRTSEEYESESGSK